MKKILYLMAVDWYWIKQRPQIIALELSKDYEVTVVYLSEVFQKLELRKEKDELPDSRRVPAIPFRDKHKAACRIQRHFMKKAMGRLDQYDMVWLGYPTLYKYIPSDYKGKIIYDCMDNHEAFCEDKKIQSEIRKNEKELLKRADIIFATSQYLKNKLMAGGRKEGIYLSRNGFEMNRLYPLKKVLRKEYYKIGYFGTISEWMDFEAVEKSLERNSLIQYHFIGPVHQTKLPSHPRIIFEGVVEHQQLYEKTKDYDCLIMPFQINEIILAVDPVKLYEYISLGKCVISVEYEEIKRFEPYVYFYKTADGLVELIEELTESGFPCKYTEEQQREFLKENSWESRCDDVIRVMEE